MKLHSTTLVFFILVCFKTTGQTSTEIKHVEGVFLGITPPISIFSTENWKPTKEHFEGEVKENRKRPEVVNFGAEMEMDPIVQDNFGLVPSKAPIANFDGQLGGFPPDPTGAAGPNHYVQAVNSTYRVYNKSGNSLSSNLPLSSLWAGSTNDGDPIVLYDRHADRWVITQFQVAGNKILFAVSTSPNPLGSYATYSYSLASFPDYPKFSIWSDGYYMTANSNSQNAIVFNRGAMLAGASSASYIALNTPVFTSQFAFKSILPADADGVLPPFGSPNYLFYFQDNAWSSTIATDVIKILKFQVNWVTPSLSSIALHQTLYPSSFNAVFTSTWEDIEQKGTSQRIDSQASFFNYRAQYLRWGNYNTVMLCHVVDVNNTNKGGIRWYELRQDAATDQFSIYQEGTFSPDDDSRFLGSIAMDLIGNIGMAYSISGPNSYPSLAYTGRRYFDALGQMTVQEYRAKEGLFYQSNFVRFGDYSHMSLDPDGTTFWFTGEYIGNGGARNSRIFAFDMLSLVGIKENELVETNLVVFQKDDLLTLSLKYVEQSKTMHVELLEMSGKSIRAEDISISNQELNLVWNTSDLPTGTYFVAVSGNSFQRTKKIIIP